MAWSAILLLGAYHGINPGMGWLFAVALGMQQGNARGVWRALPPIALGHAAAIASILVAAAVLRLAVPLSYLKIGVAALLIVLGGYRLWRQRHPRFGGMQVGFRDLTIWSFLMASAHGAGLMVLPFVLAMPPPPSIAGGVHTAHAGGSDLSTALLALAVHTSAYLAVMTATAWIVYQKLGLALLRTAWFNLDWFWAAALVVTGLVVLTM